MSDSAFKYRDPTVAIGVLFVVVAIALNFAVLGRVVIFLNAGLVVALFAWLTPGIGDREPHRALGPVYSTTILLLLLHGFEEYSGRLYETLPPRFGLEPLEPIQFTNFNLVWLTIFLVAAVGVFQRNRLSLLVVWFVALLGCIGNALFHGFLCLQSGAYVPGVITALINLPMGVVLVKLLAWPARRVESPES